MSVFRKKGELTRYDFRDRKCLWATCWAPGLFQHRGATLAGSRATGSYTPCCVNRANHGCPKQVIHDQAAYLQRRAEGWRVTS